jgi:glutamate dehydrogenase/leucine dehydrogenase
MSALFDLCDDLGPQSIVHIATPSAGLRAIVVIDNVAAGPAIGGARMAPDVSVEECVRLARAMTFKNAAAGLAHGGAKSVIFADPSMPAYDKERVMRAFAGAIVDIRGYIAGPDMGTDESCMAWVHDETGRAVGLPRELGGIPLDEIGATGFGIAIAAEVAQEFCDIRLEGARVAIQGFGAVGRHAARRLAERGAILVAAVDSRSTVTHPAGIDVDALIETKKATGQLAAHPGVTRLDRDAIVSADCDVWIPAARPDVLTADNAREVKAGLVLQGANIPATPEAEDILHRRGILSVPDFIANAGGVICAAVEYYNGSETTAFSAIEEKVLRNTREVLAKARASGTRPRQAAVEMARARIRAAMRLRRWK